MIQLGRDELGEREHAGLRLRGREGRVVRVDHLVRELRHRRDADELTRYEIGSDAPDELAEAQPLVRRRATRADAGVQDHQARDAIGALDGEPQPDRAAPVLDDDGRLAQVELVGEALDRRVVEVVRVVLDPGRLVRATEAEVVGRDRARGAGDRRDHLAIEECPRRLAVEHEHRIARALVHVVHPQAVLLDVPRLERVVREPVEPLVGRAVDLHEVSLRRERRRARAAR